MNATLNVKGLEAEYKGKMYLYDITATGEYHYIHGRRYYPDGSGEPDDEELEVEDCEAIVQSVYDKEHDDYVEITHFTKEMQSYFDKIALDYADSCGIDEWHIFGE